MATASRGKGAGVLNINLGVLGHVDSGKTSLGAVFISPPQRVGVVSRSYERIGRDLSAKPVFPSPLKTCLALIPNVAKVLSTVASTACFDKNPQSKERGITLDLGMCACEYICSSSVTHMSPLTLCMSV